MKACNAGGCSSATALDAQSTTACAATAYSKTGNYAANDRFSIGGVVTTAGAMGSATVKVTTGWNVASTYAIGEVESYSDGSPAGANGCSAPDVVIAKGSDVQIWNACNRGTDVAGTSASSYGDRYQFGTSTASWTNGNSGYTYDWKASGGTNGWSANDWGVADADKTTATWASSTTANRSKMSGPCGAGYHVPTYAETQKIGTVLGAANWGGMVTYLKIPFSGRRSWSDGTVNGAGSTGYWWSSSPSGAYGYDAHFYSGGGNLADSYNRGFGFSVRCLRNQVALFDSSALYAANDRFAYGTAGGTTAIVKVTTGGNVASTFVVGEVESYSDGSSIYSGQCDTADIAIAKGSDVQIWNACNRGAAVAGTSASSYGDRYQFGRSDTSWTNGNSGYTYDWKSPGGTDAWSANDWWVTEAAKTTATWESSVAASRTKMQWPCASGYHVPTYAETQKIGTVLGAANWGGMVTYLKIPFSGYRNWSDGSVNNAGSDGYWWSSSPNGAYGYYASFTSGGGNLASFTNRSFGFSVRCLRN